MSHPMHYHRSAKGREKERKIARWRRIHRRAEDKATFNQRFEIDAGEFLAAATTLESAIHGHVVLPWDRDYDKARRAFNPGYSAYPLAIVYCEEINDVAVCVSFAEHLGVLLVCRSGGHSLAGYSVLDGRIVVDLSLMNHVRVDPERRQVAVGSGTTLEKLNRALDAYRVHVPGGGCPGVGIGGHVQTGGYGFTSREFGMNSDAVLEFKVLLTNGRLVRANAEQNSDLFWALRGGTGNNFGVVVEVIYRTHDLWQVWGFGLRWPASQAASVLDALQKGYTTKAPSNKLGWQALLQRTRGPAFFLRGLYSGPSEEARAMLAPLLAIGTPKWQIHEYGSYLEINSKLLSDPVLLPTPPRAPLGVFTQSRYVDKPAGVDGWGELVDCFLEAPQKNDTINFEAYGGAINDPPADGSAFVHRSADLDVFVFSFWTKEVGEDAAREWVESLMNDKLGSVLSESSYQGYPMRSQKTYRGSYWGEMFPRLMAIKKKYNPTTMMRYGQSVRPAPKANAGRGDDEEIVYEPFHSTLPDWSTSSTPE